MMYFLQVLLLPLGVLCFVYSSRFHDNEEHGTAIGMLLIGVVLLYFVSAKVFGGG